MNYSPALDFRVLLEYDLLTTIHNTPPSITVMYGKLQVAVSVAMFLLATWLFISHFFLRIHLVGDELLMDALILLDLYFEYKKIRDCRLFIQAPLNWPSFLIVWLSILYWITYSALPLMDYLETFFVFAQSTMQIFRVIYSMCKTYMLLKYYRSYHVVPLDEVILGEHKPLHSALDFNRSDSDEEVIVDLSLLSATKLQPMPKKQDTVHTAVIQHILRENPVNKRIFSTETMGFSLVTISIKTRPFTMTLWIIYTDHEQFGFAIPTYQFGQQTAQHPSFCYSFFRNNDDGFGSTLFMPQLNPSVSSGPGRFEVHAGTFYILLQDELQSAFYSDQLGHANKSMEINQIEIYCME
jgi:hypothetical protein|tara:strand:+ start:4117 stop:5175 length:1059 start_codon:yes stop_codon:yes gene_type:complete